MNNIASITFGTLGGSVQWAGGVLALGASILIVSQVAEKALNKINVVFNPDNQRLASNIISGGVIYLATLAIHQAFPLFAALPLHKVVGTIGLVSMPIIFRKISLYLDILFAYRGDPSAQHNLGLRYIRGVEVPANNHQAFELFERAADQNHAYAQCNLGVCYERGIGVAVDLPRAFGLYRLAAVQNFDQAQYYLGLCYETGIGVEANMELAIAWYRRAAERNHPEARNKLRQLHAEVNPAN